jgi:phosphoribosylformimino-5-aminoimidazole carboxamide ribotide isomerase
MEALMLLYPAIDLKDGQCVRLVEGRMETAALFHSDPSQQAISFQAAGFHWLHVVDLDGAIAGEPRNVGAVTRILEHVAIPVQVGGGVRNLASVRRWLEAGAARVVIGTAAAREPAMVRQAAREHPGRIAVALDSRNGKVAVAGWVEQTDLDALELARRFEDAGVCALIVTDIARDGRKVGVNIELCGRIADAVALPVIASGGVRSAADISALRMRPGRPIQGVILGRALYDGDIDAAEALAASK